MTRPLDEKAQKARAAVERLANTKMDLSLAEWSQLSSDILDALPAGRVTEAVLQRATNSAREAYDASLAMQPRENGQAWHDAIEAALSTLEPSVQEPVAWPCGTRVSIEHDGFAGVVIGHYERLDGKRGAVLQQDGTRVVHVYGEKWLLPAAPVPADEVEG